MKPKIKNKRILITGGTSGIGIEIVKLLYMNNEVIVIARNEEKLDWLERKFTGVTTFQSDLSNLIDIENVCRKIKENFATVDILINNAATQHTPTFLSKDFDYHCISKEITLNFTSICCLCYQLLPLLLNSLNGTILNVNSGLGLTPKASSAVYCATKGALNIFSQSLRYQLENSNISVKQVFLGLVDTKMTKGRGSNKMSAEIAARNIIRGIENDVLDNDIGKVRLLRILLCFMPWLARNIMRKY